MPTKQPLPLVQLGPVGHYRIPTVVRVEGAAFPPGEVQARIHLRLETGHLLDMPLAQATIDELHASLAKLATPPEVG